MNLQTIPIQNLLRPAHNTDPGDLPFVMPVEGETDTFAFCLPCDQATWGNRYALADGRVVRAEANRVVTPEGWRPMVGEVVIGWVVNIQRRANGEWVSE